jgi:hypothetical protein
MKLRITTNDIQSIPFDETHSPYFQEMNDEWFFKNPGLEHYRLLSYLSKQFSNATLLDIGTSRGSSALALSYNKSNTIHTFDIEKCILNPKLQSLSNVHYHYDNLFNDTTFLSYKQLILSSPLLFLDISPHNGHMELEFYKALKFIGYSGLLVCDDIHHFEGMRKFWFEIPIEEKFDLTRYGHWSGTGLISFNKDLQIELGN